MLKNKILTRQNFLRLKFIRTLQAITFISLLMTMSVDMAETLETSFHQWKQDFSNFAVREGIRRKTLNQSLMRVSIDHGVMRLAHSQPEFSKTIWQYLAGAASKQRVKKGRKMLRKHHRLLSRMERKYGVQAEYIVAIWGLESNFGSNFGSKDVIRSLATLAYSSERTEFYRGELLAALRLIQSGEVKPHRMVGSWAGAMGHTQFMPSTLTNYGVDADRNGRRDLWGSLEDVFASTANYLSKSGWVYGDSWGMEVQLPRHFDWQLANPTTWLPLSEWADIGLIEANQRALPKNDHREARLFLPSGHNGPVFLVFRNFQAIKQYNNADSYVLAVGHLGDRIKGKSKIIAQWPKDHLPMSLNDKKELQYYLTAMGYDTGGVDGKIGPNTREAIRSWQMDMGMPADGYVDGAVIGMIKIAEEY